MSFRIVNGNTHTENGWKCCNRDECDIPRIPNLFLVDTAPLRKGPPLTILGAWCYWYDRNVEEIFTPVWGWSKDNDVLGQPGKNNGSNHLGGTAVDICAPKYPWGLLRMPADKVAKVEEGLRLFSPTGRIEDSLIFWGRVWRKPDEMHYQMRYPEGHPLNAQFERKLLDGYLGIYRPFVPAEPIRPIIDSIALLAELMGNQRGVKYSDFIEAVGKCLVACGCTTTARIAMWVAQIGHESEGLLWMEEQNWSNGKQTDAQYFAKYDGRMGNGPGEGIRYKGRGPIQVTGKHNYTELSKWAHSKGLVPSPTFFVDQPAQLASPVYGFIGVAWYWTTQRPLNEASDAGNLTLATKYINGGDHGLSDRRLRYNRAIAKGDALLNLLPREDNWMNNPDLIKMITEIHRETVEQKSPSRSFMAEDGRLIDTPLGIAWNDDGNTWTLVLTEAYRLDVPKAVEIVEHIAEHGVYPGSYASQDYNKWLQEFGQAYCQGLVRERANAYASKGDSDGV